jgi:hypothetical protein
MEGTTFIKDRANVEQEYKDYIQNILATPCLDDFKRSNRNSLEVEKTLISFLSQPHPDGEVHGMYTRTGRSLQIELNIDSGTIFYVKKKIFNFHVPITRSTGRYLVAIYIGETTVESDRKISYFYIFGDFGISFWDDINSTNLKDLQKLDIDLLRTVLHSQQGQKVLFKRCEEEIPSHFCDLYKTLGMFYDGKIICCDGDVLINRMILCMRSKFFFVYFTKYTNDQNTIKMNVKKIVMEKYMEFLFLNDISVDVLIESSGELLDFGNMIGDISFIQLIYHKLWDMIDAKERLNLNQLMKMYQVIDDK